MSKLISVKSWCDDCKASFESTGYGCDGHFMCARPTTPEGYVLTGAKDLTPAGWREEARPFSPLALHHAAIAAKTAVASFVFDRSLDGDAKIAERARWDAAITRERETREALAAALHGAAWGAQPDGSFVTRESLTCGGMAARTTLHAPAKQGPLAVVEDHERDDDYTLTVLRTREEAREIRDVERCQNRDAERMYAALRRCAGMVLRDGGELPYCSGQKFGSVTIHDRQVSARGALVAAGMTKFEAEALLESVMGAGALSLHGVIETPATVEYVDAPNDAFHGSRGTA